MSPVWDVGIIGAGPAGSRTAFLLARQGLRVLLLEEHEQVGEPRHCTGILGQEAFDRFPDLPREAIQSSLPPTWIVSPLGTRVRTNWFDGKAFIMDRARFDRILAERACQAGVTLWTGSRVSQIHREPESVTLAVERGAGQTESVRCQAVVVAGGISYRLHSQLGLEPPKRHLICAQTEVESNFVQEAEVYIGRKVAPGSFAWVVPIGNGRLRIGVTATQHAAHCLETLLLSPALKDRIWRDNVLVQKRPVPIDAVPCGATERVLLVGDAAGQVKPTTGGGIYYGLVGATAAAQTLEKAFALGRFDQRTLASYNRRWRSVLRKELWLGRIVRKVFECLSDKKLDGLVRACGHPSVNQLVQHQANFDWHSKNVVSFLTSRTVMAQLLSLPFLKP
ncbi:MAG: NAD(P)/FAD-dependent oxidoreductase [Elusimicrobiota bacterium]|jgi:geranylgeranyl reductase family protein